MVTFFFVADGGGTVTRAAPSSGPLKQEVGCLGPSVPLHGAADTDIQQAATKLHRPCL